ncbi:IS630 family transposase [Planomonospora algeriensis]
MRYPDSGGFTAEERAQRERLRLYACDLFANGFAPAQVARILRVSEKSAYAWRKTWRTGGRAALASTGAGGAVCKLDDAQLARLDAELRRGPAAHGWSDQRWTLARIARLIGELFGVSYTLRGLDYLLHRLGWSVQVPAHRAIERDEERIAAWVAQVWPRICAEAAERRAWIAFEDESGQSLRPPKGRTWAPVGATPVVKVSGRGSGRVSIAGLICVRPGERTRLLYRVMVFHDRKGEPKGFDVPDFTRLLQAAHRLLNAPLVVVWDNLGRHKNPAMRAFITGHDWLSTYLLPTYAPELNPAEGVWANMKGKICNLAVDGVDALAVLLKSHLKPMQYRPDLLNGFVAETGLVLQPV